jgi:DNA-binding NtrC family response regulator
MTTVLFVDNEPEVTDALRIALRHYPFDVLTADGAATAFDVLAQHDVDVVVSDEKQARSSSKLPNAPASSWSTV